MKNEYRILLVSENLSDFLFFKKEDVRLIVEKSLDIEALLKIDCVEVRIDGLVYPRDSYLSVTKFNNFIFVPDEEFALTQLLKTIPDLEEKVEEAFGQVKNILEINTSKFSTYNSKDLNSHDKIEAYEKLVLKRKMFRFSDSELTNPAETPFDVNEIEPWAQWQNNINADILLLGQEYSDINTYINTQGKVERYPDLFKYSSNKNLYEYFKIIGFDIGHPLTPNKGNPIFFTNSVMGLKPSPMSANFKEKWLSESRNEFLVPLIDIINPKIIIAIGAEATKTLSKIFGFKVIALKEMVGLPIMVREKTIFPVFHTGGLGLRNRSKDLQIQDWGKIRNFIKAL